MKDDSIDIKCTVRVQQLCGNPIQTWWLSEEQTNRAADLTTASAWGIN